MKEPWQMKPQAYSDYEAGIFGEPTKPISEEFKRWHKGQVFTALASGKPVPAEVLKDYPELATRKPFNPITELEKQTALQRWTEQGKMLDEAEARASQLRAEAIARGLGTKESLKGVSMSRLHKLLKAEAVISQEMNCKTLPEFKMEDIEKVISWLGEKDVPEQTKQSILDGMNEELEHCDITAGDPILTAKIALAHLREEPDYYEKLKKAGL